MSNFTHETSPEPKELRELREEYEDLLFYELARITRTASTLVNIWNTVSSSAVRAEILKNDFCPLEILDSPPKTPEEIFWMENLRFRSEGLGCE